MKLAVFLFTFLYFSIAGAADLDFRQISEVTTEAILSLRSGDRIVFSDGKEFVIDKFLGKGGSAAVFSVKGEPNFALKIALAGKKNLMKELVAGEAILEEFSVPRTKILAHDKLGEYAITERMPNRFYRFQEFALGKNLQGNEIPLKERTSMKYVLQAILKGENPNLSPELIGEMRKALIEFFVKISRFSVIGDFSHEHLVYDPQRNEWRLLDWTYESYVHPVRDLSWQQYSKPLNDLRDELKYRYEMDLKNKSSEYYHLKELLAEIDKKIVQERQKCAAAYGVLNSNSD